jgi:hypothetical protein
LRSIPAVRLIFDARLLWLIRTIPRPVELRTRPLLVLAPRLLPRVAACYRGIGLRHGLLNPAAAALSLEIRFDLAPFFRVFRSVFTARRAPELLLREVVLIISLRCRENPQIMFRVLVIAFRHHRISGGMGVPRKLHILLGNRLRRSANFHIRPIALVNPIDRIAAASAAASAAARTSASPTATRSLVMIVIVLALSHDSCISRLLPL